MMKGVFSKLLGIHEVEPQIFYDCRTDYSCVDTSREALYSCLDPINCSKVHCGC